MVFRFWPGGIQLYMAFHLLGIGLFHFIYLAAFIGPGIEPGTVYRSSRSRLQSCADNRKADTADRDLENCFLLATHGQISRIISAQRLFSCVRYWSLYYVAPFYTFFFPPVFI